jgi:hypothetical protein
MQQINVHLPDDLLTFVQKTADRETRTVASQIRHFVTEAARRAGVSTAANLLPWPPLLPEVSQDTLPEVKAMLAAWTEERDRLTRRETKVGAGSLMPDEQARLGWLRDSIKTQQSRVDMLEGVPRAEPRRPAPPRLGGSHG